MAEVTFNPAAFDAADEEAARRIILTPQAGQSPDERWSRETPYLAKLAADHLRPAKSDLVIDYGCGIGRLAKALVELTGCQVLGVDLSPDMRRMADSYVASEQFEVADPWELVRRVNAGLRVDGVLCAWVLQHTLDPAGTIEVLRAALKTGGTLFVVNNLGRAVPTVEERWSDDGIDVRALLATRFDMLAEGLLDPAVVGDDVSALTFWGAYRRP